MAPDTPSNRRLVAHAAALAAVLLLIAPIVRGDGTPFDADEGAMLTQVEVLHRTGGWFDRYWAADLDLDGDFVAIQNAAYDDGQIAPLVARPGHTLLVASVLDVGGHLALVLVSSLAAAIAAFAAGAIARRIRPDTAILAIWALGIGTGLAFEVPSTRGHPIGTALGALAAWGAVALVQRSRPLWPAATLLVAPLLGMLVRRETLLLGGAIAIGLATTAVRTRRPALAVAAAFPVAGALLGSLVDGRISTEWIGRSSNAHVPAASSGGESLLGSRIESLWSATLQPAELSGAATLGGVALLVAVFVGLAGVVLHRRRREVGDLTVGLGIAAVLVLARVTILREPPDLAPSLFAATPALLWGLAAIRRDHLHDDGARFAAVAAAAFAGAVVMTQYSTGGGLEWGARYLQVSLPLLVPLILVPLVDLVRSLPIERRSPIAATLVLITSALTISGLVAHHESRALTATQLDRSLDRAATTQSRVVIATFPSLPRSAVDQFANGQRWLWVWPDGIPALLEAFEQGELDDPPITDAVLVSHDEDVTDAGLAASGWERGSSEPLPANPDDWRIATIHRAGTRP